MSLQDALKESVFALVDSVQPPKKYKAVILDRHSRHIIDLVIDKNQLLNRHVANVLMLDEPRQSETYLEAVYIVEQTPYTLGCIQADFTRVPPRYKAAHIFLIPSARGSASELERFKNSAASRFFAKVDVAPFSFLALEKQVFTLGSPSANFMLYNESCRQSVLDFVDLTGRQLANVCRVLGEYPYVRHSELWKVTRNNAFPRLVAAATVKHLEAARAQYMTPELESDPRPTLLIVDRSIDLTSPLLHSFGFQAMALDLLGSQFESQTDFRTFKSKDGSTTGNLTEQDNVWVGLRHQHYVTATNQLNKRLADLKDSNPHFANKTSEVSVRDVRDMFAALPDFMKSKDNIELNLEIAYELMAHVTEDPLRELAEAEQFAALGSTVDGERHPELLTDMLVGLLGRKDVPREAKIRLLAMYVLYRESGLYATDFDKLRQHAGLSAQDIATVEALDYLGHQTRKAGGQAAARASVPKPLVRENPDQPIAFARVRPGLRTVVEQLLAHELDRSAFPFTGDEPNLEQEAMNVATSLRNPRQRATWAQNVPVTSASAAASEKDASPSQKSRPKPKKRTIVFMLGGFTAAESAAMYELSEERPRTIMLGGHDWLTPSKYVDFLSRINAPREQLELPEDKPEPKVPEFLSASDRQNQKSPPRHPQQQHQQPSHHHSSHHQPPHHQQPQHQQPHQHRTPPPGSSNGRHPARGPAGDAVMPGPGGAAPRPAPQTAHKKQLQRQKDATPVAQSLGVTTLNPAGDAGEPDKEKKDKKMKLRLKGAFKKKK